MFRPINMDVDETTLSTTETRNCSHSVYNCLNNGHKSTSTSQQLINGTSPARGHNLQSVTSPRDDVPFRRFSTSRCYWQPREAPPPSKHSVLVPSASSAFTTPNRKHLEQQPMTSQQTESRGDGNEERRRGRVKRIAQCFDTTQPSSKQQQQQQSGCEAVKQSNRHSTARHTVLVQQLTNTANSVPVVRVVSAPVPSRTSVPVVPSVVPYHVVPTSASTSRRRPQIPEICLAPALHQSTSRLAVDMTAARSTNTDPLGLQPVVATSLQTPVTAPVSLPAAAARRTSFYKSLEHLPLTSLTPRDYDIILQDGKKQSEMMASTVDETLKHKSLSTQHIASRDQQQAPHRHMSVVGDGSVAAVRPMFKTTQTVDCRIKLRPPDTDQPRDVSRDITRTVTIKSGRVLQGHHNDVITNRALQADVSSDVIDRNRWIEEWLNRQDKPRGRGRTDSAVGVVGSPNRKRQISEVRVSVNNVPTTTNNGLVACTSLGGDTTTSLSKVLVSPTFTRKHFDELLTSRQSDVTNSLPRDVDRRYYLSTSSLMTSSPYQTLNQTLIDIVRQSHLQAFPPTTTISTSPTSWSTTLHSPPDVSPSRLTSDVTQQDTNNNNMAAGRQLVSELNCIQSQGTNTSCPLQRAWIRNSVPFQLEDSVLDNRLSPAIVASVVTTGSQSPGHTLQQRPPDDRLTPLSPSTPVSPLHLLPLGLHNSVDSNSPVQQLKHVTDVTPDSLACQLVPTRSTSLLSRPSQVHHQGLPTLPSYSPLPSTPLPQRAQVGYISVPQMPTLVPHSIVPIQQTVPARSIVPQSIVYSTVPEPTSKLSQQPTLPVVGLSRPALVIPALPPVTSQISDSVFTVNGFVTSALDSAIARLSQHVNNDVTAQQQQQHLKRDDVLTSPLTIESSDSVSEFGYDLANDSMVDENRQQTELVTSSVDVPSNGLREEVEVLHQLEVLRQRRALQLCKDDSFNRPDTPTNTHNKHKLPLPRDSVILRHRRHRQMTSSSTSSSVTSSDSDSSSSSEDIYELTTRRTVRRRDRQTHRQQQQQPARLALHVQTAV